MRTAARVTLIGISSIVACAASQPGPSSSAPPKPRGSASPVAKNKPSAKPSAQPPAPRSSAARRAPSAPQSTPKPQDPSACPDGMILVDGEYCTEVENKCLKSWFDKSNKKTICEEFEPWTKCVGTKVKKRFCIDRY